MKQVRFTAAYPPELTHPMHGALAREGSLSRAELLQWGPTEAVTTLTWYDGDPAAVERVLAAVETTTTELVPADGGTYAFVRQPDYEFAPALMEVLGQARVVFLPPVTFLDTGEARFSAVGEAAAVGDFHAALDEHVDCRIERVRPYERGETAPLTGRQRAALEAAATVGYYEVPRTGSVADVAAELNCGHSTAGDLLRRAEAAVVEAVVGE